MCTLTQLHIIVTCCVVRRQVHMDGAGVCYFNKVQLRIPKKKEKKLGLYNRSQEIRHACSDCPTCANHTT